jgi:uncharacterized protein YecT (DUF1311 family)
LFCTQLAWFAHQLREAVNGLMTRQESHEFDTFVLNRENEELRERIQFLESVISGEQEELLECMGVVMDDF